VEECQALCADVLGNTARQVWKLRGNAGRQVSRHELNWSSMLRVGRTAQGSLVSEGARKISRSLGVIGRAVCTFTKQGRCWGSRTAGKLVVGHGPTGFKWILRSQKSYAARRQRLDGRHRLALRLGTVSGARGMSATTDPPGTQPGWRAWGPPTHRNITPHHHRSVAAVPGGRHLAESFS